MKKRPKSKSENQRRYLKSLENNKITFCEGPAGSGKTYLATVMALQGLQDGLYHKLIISRPLVQSGENTGYLPGGINDKLDPYMKPIYDILDYYLTKQDISELIQDKRLEIVPFAYMRGRNFFNSFILLDEVQNCSYEQLVLALTRYAKGSKMVLTGDIAQSDLPNYKQGGLYQIMNKLRNTDDIGVIELDNSDIVREPIVRTILEKLDDKSQTPKPRTEDFSFERRLHGHAVDASKNGVKANHKESI